LTNLKARGLLAANEGISRVGKVRFKARLDSHIIRRLTKMKCSHLLWNSL